MEKMVEEIIRSKPENLVIPNFNSLARIHDRVHLKRFEEFPACLVSRIREETQLLR